MIFDFDLEDEIERDDPAPIEDPMDGGIIADADASDYRYPMPPRTDQIVSLRKYEREADDV